MVSIELPLKPSEAAALADLIFQFVEGRPLNDELRNRLAGRVTALELTSMSPYMGSLQKDPIHFSAYYIAVDAIGDAGTTPLLLRMALASSPVSALFPDPLLIGRMRPGGGREIIVNAIPFASTDHQNIRTFADRIDRSFLPRPQGPQSSITVAINRPASKSPLPSMPSVLSIANTASTSPPLPPAKEFQRKTSTAPHSGPPSAARGGRAGAWHWNSPVTSKPLSRPC